MKIPTRVLYAAISISILCLIISCVQSSQINNSYIHRLKNRGIVPISAENPYIAANALLEKEKERSPEIKGFIEHSGAPNAIRVEQGFISPLYIEFYYTGKSEYFTAEENNGIWLINGPYQIDSSTLADIKKVTIFNSSKSKVELPKPSATVPGPLLPKKPVTTEPTTVITPIVTLQQTPTSLKTLATPSASTPAGTDSIQSLTERFGKTKAETTPKGDIVHYVSYPGETIAMLCRWYTFDVSNQQRLMRINHIGATQTLSIGDSVVIPGYLIKNKNILTQEGLSALEEAVSKGSIK